MVSDLVCSVTCHPYNDPVSSWEMIKYKIRDLTIRYSKQKARERRKKESELLLNISRLEQELFLKVSADTRSQLNELRNDLLSYYNCKLQGTIIRLRARWMEKGEQNTKYFLNLERRNKQNNVIRKIVGKDGHN